MQGMPEMVFLRNECARMENSLVQPTSYHLLNVNTRSILTAKEASRAARNNEEYDASSSARAAEV